MYILNFPFMNQNFLLVCDFIYYLQLAQDMQKYFTTYFDILREIVLFSLIN